MWKQCSFQKMLKRVWRMYVCMCVCVCLCIHTHTHTHYPRHVVTACAIFTLVILHIKQLTSVQHPYVFGDPPSRFYRESFESAHKTPRPGTRLKISSIIQMKTFFIRPNWKSCYPPHWGQAAPLSAHWELSEGKLHHCLHTGNYLRASCATVCTLGTIWGQAAPLSAHWELSEGKLHHCLHTGN